MVTNFLDTRKDPDAEIDWDSLNQDTNSKEVQGIIKLKRATAEGKTITMVYTDPDTFQSYIDEYNATGSETAKQQALKHFTIEEGCASNFTGDGASIFPARISSVEATIRYEELYIHIWAGKQ
ncbi:MAG: hypothetical protein ACLRTR_07815 [Clostridia bacterium]